MAFITNVISHLKAAGHLAKDVHIDPAKAKLIDEALAKSVKSDFDVSKVTAAERNALHESRVAIIDALVKPGVNGIQAQEVLTKAFRDKVVGEFGAGDAGSRLQKNFADVMGDAYKKRAEDAAAVKAGGNVPPRGGGDNVHIDSETALKRATTEAEQIARREGLIKGWQDGQDRARNLFLSQMDTLHSADFTARKDALTKLTAVTPNAEGVASDVIGVSGYIARSDSAAAKVADYLKSDERIAKLKSLKPDLSDQELQAYKGKPRTPEEIESIFKDKPGYEWEKVQDTNLTPEQRIAALTDIKPKHQITTKEWDLYKSHVRGQYLHLEQDAILGKLDVLRLSKNERMPAAELAENFKRLREIQKDGDFQSVAAAQRAAESASFFGRIKNGLSNLTESSTPGGIAKRLNSGDPMSDKDINRLEVYYNRYFREGAKGADVPAASGKLGQFLGMFSGNGKEPSKMDRVTEWHTGWRVSPVVSWRNAAGAAVLTTAGSAGNVYLNPGVYEHDKDGNPVAFSKEKPGFFRDLGKSVLVSPVADYFVGGSGDGKDWYSAAISREMSVHTNTQPVWEKQVRLGKGVEKQAITAVSELNTERAAVATSDAANETARKSVTTAQAENEAADKEKMNQTALAGERKLYKQIAESDPVATIHQVNQALGQAQLAGEISRDQMKALAQKMLEISTGDGKGGMTKKELEAAKATPEFQVLKPEAKDRILADLAPRVN